jgi:rubredoxin
LTLGHELLYLDPSRNDYYVINSTYKELTMQKWECPCGYVYDPAVGDVDNGVAAGTAWEDVPEGWTCPICGAEKESFSKI